MNEGVKRRDPTSLNVPANFGLSELTVFTSTRPDTPPHASVERRAINVKEFVGQTPRERSMELDAEERDAEKALREAQLQATRVWLRQVEEENEDKLRERLAEQRKMQQEHFKKLEIQQDYLPPNLAFGGLPSGKTMKRGQVNGHANGDSEEFEDDSDSEENELRHRENRGESKKWAQNVHNEIAGSPTSMHTLHSVQATPPGMSQQKSRSCCSSSYIPMWFLLIILHDIGLVILCLWVFNNKDSNEIPWKWLSFVD